MGNKTITKYANMLKNLWQEFDHYQCIETKCPEDALKLLLDLRICGCSILILRKDLDVGGRSVRMMVGKAIDL